MDIGWTGPGLSSDITNPTYLTDYITHIPFDPTIAKIPVPADDTNDIPRDVVLSWEPGKYADTHNVYIGTSFDDVNDARPNNMGFSETTDFVTYKNLGHFNEGVMKTTNFTGPKHGAVTHLTLDELKAVAEHWKMDIKLD